MAQVDPKNGSISCGTFYVRATRWVLGDYVASGLATKKLGLTS